MKKILLLSFICLLSSAAFAQWTSNGTSISTSQNVGVGTSTPAYKLDVNGDVRSKNIVMPAAYQLSSSLSDKLSYQGTIFGHYSLGWISDSWSKEGFSLWQSGYAGIKLFTGGRPQLSITYGGNVGIGTDAPEHKLDVAGNIRSANLDLYSGGQVGSFLSNKFLYKERNMGHYAIGWMNDSWNSTGATLWQAGFGGIKFFTGGRFQMSINASGNVGVGTESPTQKLDIAGNVKTQNILIPTGYQVSSSLSDKLTYQGTTFGHYALGWVSDSSSKEGHSLWQSGYAGIKLFTGGRPQMSITFGGNVGVGTDAPEHKLDVAGDVRSANLNLYSGGQVGSYLSNKFLYKERNMGHYAIGWMNDSWNQNGATLWQAGFGGIKFFTGGEFRMSIHNSGNVGIGTESPKERLDVNGNIRGNTILANEVKIEVQTWPDFVFDKDYKLLSLEEVKTHIDEHKHLPDVPSEKEVSEEGISVG